jgi:hypothetical protein
LKKLEQYKKEILSENSTKPIIKEKEKNNHDR